MALDLQVNYGSSLSCLLSLGDLITKPEFGRLSASLVDLLVMSCYVGFCGTRYTPMY